LILQICACIRNHQILTWLVTRFATGNDDCKLTQDFAGFTDTYALPKWI